MPKIQDVIEVGGDPDLQEFIALERSIKKKQDTNEGIVTVRQAVIVPKVFGDESSDEVDAVIDDQEIDDLLDKLDEEDKNEEKSDENHKKKESKTGQIYLLLMLFACTFFCISAPFLDYLDNSFFLRP